MRVHIHQQLFDEHSNSDGSQQKFQLGQSNHKITYNIFNKSFFRDFSQ